MITTKGYITREIAKLKKTRKQLKQELGTLSQTGPVKDAFKNANIILQKELITIDAKIAAFLWVANTNQKSLPKLKVNKKEKKSPEFKKKNDTKSSY